MRTGTRLLPNLGQVRRAAQRPRVRRLRRLGPGQLDGELDEGSWIVEPALPKDVFTDEPETLWRDVLKRKGGPFGVLSLMPPDPSRN